MSAILRKQSSHRLVPAFDGMSKRITVRISDIVAVRLNAAATTSRLSRDDLVRAGVANIIWSVEHAAEINIPNGGPELQLSETTRKRMAEIDDVLGIEVGQGIAETVLANVIADVMDGDIGLITGGWVFDDPAQVEANLACVAHRWALDDMLTASRCGKESA